MATHIVLDNLGKIMRTDKSSEGHNYLHFYERFLFPLREKPITLIEAGIGGYHYPDRGGESLRMWAAYFSNPAAKIIGFDVYAKNPDLAPGATIFHINQIDETGLINHFGNIPIDVFIDDASHVNNLSIRTFEIMFPLLKPGGIYIWEDIHTSYWEQEYNGHPNPLSGKVTAASFLHRLQDGLQVDTLEEQHRGAWDGHIEEMHFMRNTCVIIKRKQ